jgi:hypothetical protein
LNVLRERIKIIFQKFSSFSSSPGVSELSVQPQIDQRFGRHTGPKVERIGDSGPLTQQRIQPKRCHETDQHQRASRACIRHRSRSRKLKIRAENAVRVPPLAKVNAKVELSKLPQAVANAPQ